MGDGGGVGDHRIRVFGVPLALVRVDERSQCPLIVYRICQVGIALMVDMHIVMIDVHVVLLTYASLQFLKHHATDVQGLFRHSGSVAEISLLRDEFESNRCEKKRILCDCG